MINQAMGALLKAGISVIPTRSDKTPSLPTWKPYQARRATAEEFASWAPADGLGIVCGAGNGGIFCIDIDLKNDVTGKVSEDFLDLVTEQAPTLPDRLVAERTPNGGWHFIGRSTKAIGNLKLARTREGKVLIETRGDGGYFCAAPTPGYRLTQGTLEAIPEVTPEELDILLDCARALSLEEREARPAKAPVGTAVRPLDDYDARSTPEDVAGLLEAHGWKRLFARGQAMYFRRPDKQGRGISATYNHIPGRFYVFTTSTKFESEHVYKPYAVYAILEHGGDFVAAARALGAMGYGSQPQSQPVAPPTEAANVQTLEKAIFHLYDHGVKKGVAPGWTGLGKLYQVVKGQLNIVTGIPSHGKSEFVDALMVNLAESQGWRFVVYSPENYPVELHARKLIEKHVGRSMFGQGRMSVDELGSAVRWVMEHFAFLDGVDESVTLDSIFKAVEEEKAKGRVDGVVIDPWNELEGTRPDKMSETDFIGLCLKRARMFARRHEVAFWIVAHPYKLKKDPKTLKYPVPTMYDISGSAHWYNKADNGIVVWRDFEQRITEILVQKVKFKYYGKVGSVEMRYELESGRYVEVETADHFREPHVNRQVPTGDEKEIHF